MSTGLIPNFRVFTFPTTKHHSFLKPGFQMIATQRSLPCRINGFQMIATQRSLPCRINGFQMIAGIARRWTSRPQPSQRLEFFYLCDLSCNDRSDRLAYGFHTIATIAAIIVLRSLRSCGNQATETKPLIAHVVLATYIFHIFFFLM